MAVFKSRWGFVKRPFLASASSGKQSGGVIVRFFLMAEVPAAPGVSREEL